MRGHETLRTDHRVLGGDTKTTWTVVCLAAPTVMGAGCSSEITDTRRQSMEDFVNVTFVVEQGDRGALVTVTSDSQGETLVNYLVGDANST